MIKRLLTRLRPFLPVALVCAVAMPGCVEKLPVCPGVLDSTPERRVPVEVAETEISRADVQDLREADFRESEETCRDEDCTSPPTWVCEDELVLKMYEATGYCEGEGNEAKCIYDFDLIDCPQELEGGYCIDGFCAVDNPCAPNPCDEIPGDVCVDGANKLYFEFDGLCDAVLGAPVCHYHPTLYYCPEYSGGPCLEDTCCWPDCDGKECGDDGCGGQCGTCPEGIGCTAEGLCQGPCQPDCLGKQCGWDGCSGVCGQCPANQPCNNGTCLSDCQPDCSGRECGSDGCGALCSDGCPDDGPCEQGICIGVGPPCEPENPCQAPPQSVCLPGGKALLFFEVPGLCQNDDWQANCLYPSVFKECPGGECSDGECQ